MTDTLKKLVRAGDLARAARSRLEPDRTILPPRNSDTRLICFDCRRSPVWFGHSMEWTEHRKRTKTCPTCGGRLVEVTG